MPVSECHMSRSAYRQVVAVLARQSLRAVLPMDLRLACSGSEAVDLEAAGDPDDTGLILRAGKSPAFLVARGLARLGRSRTKKAGSRILSRKAAMARSRS